MPGRVVNLSAPGSRFPDPIVVDTNLIVEQLIVPFLGVLPPVNSVYARRANQFFSELVANSGTGIVTPTALNEFVHMAVKFKYRHERLHLGTSAQ